MQCKVGCRDDENCDDDEYCGHRTNQCEIGCRNDENCDDDKYCDYFGTKQCKVGCRNDESCEKFKYCDYDSRTCMKGCRSRKDCERNEYCDFSSRMCEKGCLIKTHCQTNEYCDDNNECRMNVENWDSQSRKDFYKCNRNEDCSDEHYCTFEGCKNICDESACGENSKCISLNHKEYCACIDGFFKTPYECIPHSGTKPVFGLNDPLLCFHFCKQIDDGCELINNEIYCVREKSLKITTPPPLASFRPPSCECCQLKIKPGCAYEIDPNVLRTLLG
jgi:hypothetical protein